MFMFIFIGSSGERELDQLVLEKGIMSGGAQCCQDHEQDGISEHCVVDFYSIRQMATFSSSRRF